MSATDNLRLPSINVRTLHHTTTRHNADVVHTLPVHPTAFTSPSPSTSPFSSLIAVGNYELHTATGTKVGGIALYEVDGAAATLTERSYHSSSAVFDLQWHDGLLADRPLLACADAAGSVSVLELRRDESGFALTSVAQVDVYGGSGASCLSVDWDDGHCAATATNASPSSSATCVPSSIAASSSTGSVSVLSFHSSTSSLSLLGTCTPHSLEVWSCAFSRHCSTSLYSGADDCRLFHIDTRSLHSPSLLSEHHSAGVCCVLPSVVSEHLLATGCYDERVRVWDMRAMRRPVGEKRLNGGVWRLRWGRKAADGSEDIGRLLCCCMHAGVQLVEVADGGASLRVLSEYYEHQSLAYGGDWVTLHSGDASGANELNNAIVSCSFYDNSLRLWQPVSGQAAAADEGQWNEDSEAVK